MNTPEQVYVVDDDAAVQDALTLQLGAAGYEVMTFSSAEDFLEYCTADSRGCIILDVDMPGMKGPALQEELGRCGIQLPIIFLSGHGTIPTTVRTIKAGAIDFLTKPVKGSVLLARVREALEKCALMCQQTEEYRDVYQRIARLTEREREIMQLVIQGHASKEIALILGISYRTVELHRSRVMQKTGAANLLELVHFAQVLETPPKA